MAQLEWEPWRGIHRAAGGTRAEPVTFSVEQDRSGIHWAIQNDTMLRRFRSPIQAKEFCQLMQNEIDKAGPDLRVVK